VVVGNLPCACCGCKHWCAGRVQLTGIPAFAGSWGFSLLSMNLLSPSPSPSLRGGLQLTDVPFFAGHMFLNLLSPCPSPWSLCRLVQLTDVPFFAGRVELGKSGWEDIVRADLEGLTESEAAGLEALKAELKGSIEKGIAFANKAPAMA